MVMSELGQTNSPMNVLGLLINVLGLHINFHDLLIKVLGLLMKCNIRDNSTILNQFQIVG